MSEYGYIRVSTREQNEARQWAALLEYGIRSEHIFTDKQSGKNFDRPQYRCLLRRLKPGDVLVVKSIDRLGRDYGEILEQWRVISKGKGVDIVILDMPLLDTRRDRDLTGVLIADIVLQLLSYVAQTERENILQRQAEGIAAARLKGVHMGRPRKELPEDFGTLYQQWQRCEFTDAELAQRCGIAKRTLYRKLREYRARTQKEKNVEKELNYK